MATKTISVDAGNGFVNWYDGKETGSFPSVRAEITGAQLQGFDNVNYDTLLFNGQLYAIGETALQVRNSESHGGKNRYGLHFHQSLVAAAIAQAGIGTSKRGDSVDLVLFVPPRFFNEQRDFIVENFMNAGAVEIEYNGKAHKFTYKSVKVLIEGHASMFSIIFDSKGKSTGRATDFAGQWLVVDGGAYTLDTLLFQDGKPNAEMLETSTNENLGLKSQVFMPILQKLRTHNPRAGYLRVEEIDAVFMNWINHGDSNLVIAGKQIDLGNELQFRCEALARNTMDYIETSYQSLQTVAGVLIVGGQAQILEPMFKNWRSDVNFIAADNPSFSNAIGGYNYAMAKSKK